MVSLTVRLVLAMACGGAVGYGRSRTAHTAGLRTYMIIAIGAAVTAMITPYEYAMLQGPWAETAAEVGLKYDASRLAAQAVAGVGFLGVGIIVKVAHQQVVGLTTATGLFATVCLGLAAGLGFYEMVIPALVLIVVVLNVMNSLENSFKRRLRNITLNVEYNDPEDIAAITGLLEEQGVRICEIEVERAERTADQCPSAVFNLQLGKTNRSHSGIMTTLAELSCVHSVQELIA
jgi:putative Mg2+ transporter-C (MgtC) family protein